MPRGRPVVGTKAQPVGDDLDAVRLLAVHPRVALSDEQFDDLGRGEALGHRHLERDHDPVEPRGAEGGEDRARRVAPHRRPAAPAVQHRGPREQQLQVVVELGHGADGGARGPHQVGLVDGDGGRDAVDAAGLVEPGLVHPVEELARVRGERLDVAALPLAVHGVEGEGGLAGPAHPGDHAQLAEGEVEVDALQVVLAGAAHADDGAGAVMGARSRGDAAADEGLRDRAAHEPRSRHGGRGPGYAPTPRRVSRHASIRLRRQRHQVRIPDRVSLGSRRAIFARTHRVRNSPR